MVSPSPPPSVARVVEETEQDSSPLWMCCRTFLWTLHWNEAAKCLIDCSPRYFEFRWDFNNAPPWRFDLSKLTASAAEGLGRKCGPNRCFLIPCSREREREMKKRAKMSPSILIERPRNSLRRGLLVRTSSSDEELGDLPRSFFAGPPFFSDGKLVFLFFLVRLSRSGPFRKRDRERERESPFIIVGPFENGERSFCGRVLFGGAAVFCRGIHELCQPGTAGCCIEFPTLVRVIISCFLPDESVRGTAHNSGLRAGRYRRNVSTRRVVSFFSPFFWATQALLLSTAARNSHLWPPVSRRRLASSPAFDFVKSDFYWRFESLDGPLFFLSEGNVRRAGLFPEGVECWQPVKVRS